MKCINLILKPLSCDGDLEFIGFFSLMEAVSQSAIRLFLSVFSKKIQEVCSLLETDSSRLFCFPSFLLCLSLEEHANIV